MSENFSVRAPKNDYANKTRKELERDYAQLVKQLHKLDDKFKKINIAKDPDKVKRNLLKSRGAEVLKNIKLVEKELKFAEGEGIPAADFFKEN